MSFSRSKALGVSRSQIVLQGPKGRAVHEDECRNGILRNSPVGLELNTVQPAFEALKRHRRLLGFTRARRNLPNEPGVVDDVLEVQLAGSFEQLEQEPSIEVGDGRSRGIFLREVLRRV